MTFGRLRTCSVGWPSRVTGCRSGRPTRRRKPPRARSRRSGVRRTTPSVAGTANGRAIEADSACTSHPCWRHSDWPRSRTTHATTGCEPSDRETRRRSSTMPTTKVIRYRTKPEHADENERLVREVFAELAQENPAGLRYATFRLADGVSFVHVAVTDGDENPLTSSPAFAAFQADIGQRCAEGPAPSDATVIGNFGLLA